MKNISIQRITNGSPVRSQDMLKKIDIKPGENVSIVSPSGRIIGLGIARSKNKIKTDRIFINEFSSNK